MSLFVWAALPRNEAVRGDSMGAFVWRLLHKPGSGMGSGAFNSSRIPNSTDETFCSYAGCNSE